MADWGKPGGDKKHAAPAHHHADAGVGSPLLKRARKYEENQKELTSSWGEVDFTLERPTLNVLNEVFDLLDIDKDGTLDHADLIRPGYKANDQDVQFLQRIFASVGGLPKGGLGLKQFIDRCIRIAQGEPFGVSRWRRLEVSPDTGETVTAPTLDLVPAGGRQEATIEDVLKAINRRVNKVLLEYFEPMRLRLQISSKLAVESLWVYRENYAMIHRTYQCLDRGLGDGDGELDSSDDAAWLWLLDQKLMKDDEYKTTIEEYRNALVHRVLSSEGGAERYTEGIAYGGIPRAGKTYQTLIHEAEIVFNDRLNVLLRDLCGVLQAAGYDECRPVPTPVVGGGYIRDVTTEYGAHLRVHIPDGRREWLEGSANDDERDLPYGRSSFDRDAAGLLIGTEPYLANAEGTPLDPSAPELAHVCPVTVAMNICIQPENSHRIRNMFRDKDKDENGELDESDFTAGDPWWQMVKYADAPGPNGEPPDGRVTLDEFVEHGFGKGALKQEWKEETLELALTGGVEEMPAFVNQEYKSILSFLQGEEASTQISNWPSIKSRLNGQVAHLLHGLS